MFKRHLNLPGNTQRLAVLLLLLLLLYIYIGMFFLYVKKTHPDLEHGNVSQSGQCPCAGCRDPLLTRKLLSRPGRGRRCDVGMGNPLWQYGEDMVRNALFTTKLTYNMWIYVNIREYTWICLNIWEYMWIYVIMILTSHDARVIILNFSIMDC